VNGNGRWSQMLANIWLKLKGSNPTIWPDAAIAETSIIRDEYLAAVKAADTMNFPPLIALHEKYTSSDLPEDE
jgi:hypothetical protein